MTKDITDRLTHLKRVFTHNAKTGNESIAKYLLVVSAWSFPPSDNLRDFRAGVFHKSVGNSTITHLEGEFFATFSRRKEKPASSWSSPRLGNFSRRLNLREKISNIVLIKLSMLVSWWQTWRRVETSGHQPHNKLLTVQPDVHKHISQSYVWISVGWVIGGYQY